MKTNAFLLRVIICFLLSLIPLHELENRIFSKRVELRGRKGSAPNIVIVEIGSQDFKQLKRRFANSVDSRGEPWQLAPEDEAQSAKADRLEGLRELFFWDPSVFREALRKLVSQEPAAVLISWYISPEVVQSLSDPGVELLAHHPKVFWSSQFDLEGNFRKPSRLLSNSNSKNSGFNNLQADSDGVIRRSFMFREKEASLAWVAHEAINGPLSGDSPENQTPFLINYIGPSGSFTYCRLTGLLSTPIDPNCSDLKNKIVIVSRDARKAVNTYEDSLGSAYFHTPLGEMNRAEIIANELQTVVNGRRIIQIPFLIHGLLILAMILITAFYIIYYPFMISVIAIAGTGFAIVAILIQVFLQLFDIYVPSANLGVSVLVTYLVFTGYRIAVQENQQWRSLKQAQYLRELDQMKSNFLSLVSHDLKTPIAKIQAVVERLNRENPALKESLESIDNSNNELKHYITSVLNLSRIESQKVILNKKSNDINRIIEEVLKRLKAVAQVKSITFEQNLEPLFSVECDEDLIRQVMTNLVDNAIKYSPQNSKVIISSYEEEGFIRVDIQDFGPGISNDQLPLMFQKFNRFLRPMNEQVKGTGLGLYLSKYFIELHGGTIRLRSELGLGATFTFTLPLSGGESESILS